MMWCHSLTQSHRTSHMLIVIFCSMRKKRRRGSLKNGNTQITIISIVSLYISIHNIYPWSYGSIILGLIFIFVFLPANLQHIILNHYHTMYGAVWCTIWYYIYCSIEYASITPRTKRFFLDYAHNAYHWMLELSAIYSHCDILIHCITYHRIIVYRTQLKGQGWEKNQTRHIMHRKFKHPAFTVAK